MFDFGVSIPLNRVLVSIDAVENVEEETIESQSP